MGTTGSAAEGISPVHTLSRAGHTAKASTILEAVMAARG